MPATLIHQSSVPWDRSQPRARMLWDVVTLTWSEEKNIDQVMEDRWSEPVKDLQIGSSWYSLICWCCYLCGVYNLVILGKLLQGRRNSFSLTMTETSRRAMQHIYHEFCIVYEKIQTRICTQICTEGTHERSLVSLCLLQFIMTFRCFYDLLRVAKSARWTGMVFLFLRFQNRKCQGKDALFLTL